MRGLELIFPNHSNVKLDRLLFGLPVDDCQFFIDDGIAYQKNIEIELRQYVDISYIQKISQRDHFILSLVLQIYPSNACLAKIENYRDYVTCDCSLLLLLYDGNFVEVYSKEKLWIHKLIENAEELGATEISIKTDITDKRTTMYV